jgi:hypothetical protein
MKDFHLLIPLFSWLMFTLSSAQAAENKNTVATEAIVYSVDPENIDQFKKIHKEIHNLLEKQPGFIGSFRGQGASYIGVAGKENEMRQVSTKLIHQEMGETRNNVFIDYVFWNSLKDKHAAAETLTKHSAFKKFGSLITAIHGVIEGNNIDLSTYMQTNFNLSILEVAFYHLKKPFKEHMAAARPEILEWLEHLRGYRGLITAQAANNSLAYSDIVVWSTLENALYAVKALNKYNWTHDFNSTFEYVSLYGHFHILGTHGTVRMGTK